jgi:hypothetical protein
VLEPDPVRFDFALCHFGMSGRCPAKRNAAVCAKCVLAAPCVGRTKVSPAQRSMSTEA